MYINLGGWTFSKKNVSEMRSWSVYSGWTFGKELQRMAVEIMKPVMKLQLFDQRHRIEWEIRGT